MAADNQPVGCRAHVSPGDHGAPPERPAGVRRPAVPAACRHAVGAAAAARALPVPEPAAERLLQARRAQYFLARRDGRVVGRITAQIDAPSTRITATRWGMFGFLEFEDDPEVLDALLDAAEEWCAARPRPDGRADGLHHERGERRAHRGVRARADDPPAVAPAVLPAALEAGRPGQGDGPVSAGSSISDREQRCADPAELAERSRTKYGIRIRKMTGCTCAASWTSSPRSTTPPGRRTGASSPTARRTSTASPRSCSSSMTGLVHGRRERHARRSRWRSRSRTSTRSTRG